MLSEPFFQVRELDRPRLLQRTRSKPAHPVVGRSNGCGYGPMLPNGLFDRFPGFFDSFFNIHGISVLTL
jgi:hypothetical protein